MADSQNLSKSRFPEALHHPLPSGLTARSQTLFEGELLLRQPGSTCSGEGRLLFHWLPGPRVGFEFHLSSGDVPGAGEALLEIPAIAVSSQVIITNLQCSQRDTFTCTCGGIVTKSITVGPILPVDRVLFHVPNLSNYIGTVIGEPGTPACWHGRLQLASDDWTVVLDQRAQADELTAMCDETGFALAHIGMLRRADGSLFTVSEGSKALDALYYFLSFVRGLWCGPILVEGRQGDARGWQQWNAPRLSRWKGVRSWFPYQEPSSLTQAYQGFMAKWTNALWSEPIRHAIHWYVEANLCAGGVEGALVLAQAALELLGWLYLVEDPATSRASMKQFDQRWKAQDRIRCLLGALQVPTGIPAALQELHAAAASLKALDGPAVYVELRNGIVHPKHSRRASLRQTPDEARRQAWQLGLWYIEMILLRLFGYDGVYYDRFERSWPGVRKLVPWVTSA